MRLLEVGIQNFKSLKSVTFKPGPLSVFIGPNGAGKSNVCEALDFIGEMYRSALNVAMTTHGGYENLVHWGQDGPASTMGLTVKAKLSKSDLRQTWLGEQNETAPHEVTVRHEIDLSQGNDRIDDPYRISAERLRYEGKISPRHKTERILEITKDQAGFEIEPSAYALQNFSSARFLSQDASLDVVRATLASNTTGMLPWTMESLVLPSIPLRSSLGALALYDMAPESLRRGGIPTPTPKVGRDGSNLPAFLARLRSHEPEAFQTIVDTLSAILPTLDRLELRNSPPGRLSLEFHEIESARPWSAEEVSAGTLRMLTLLTILHDPDNKVVVIEEPENGLHPWAINQLLDACQLASQTKQVILTTHSPVVVDRVSPDEVWIVSKPGAETHVDRLVDLDPDAKLAWADGEIDLSKYLGSGVVPEAVPSIAL